MTIGAVTLDDLELSATGLAVGDEVADLLFREARSVSSFRTRRP